MNRGNLRMQRGYFKNEYGGNLKINRGDLRINTGNFRNE